MNTDFDFLVSNIDKASDWALSFVLTATKHKDWSDLSVDQALNLVALRHAILREMGQRCAEAYIAKYGEPT